MRASGTRRNLSAHTTSSVLDPEESAIQKEAYYLWQEKGCPTGLDLDLWFEAKERLRHHAAAGDRPRIARATASAPQFPLSLAASRQLAVSTPNS